MVKPTSLALNSGVALPPRTGSSVSSSAAAPPLKISREGSIKKEETTREAAAPHPSYEVVCVCPAAPSLGAEEIQDPVFAEVAAVESPAPDTACGGQSAGISEDKSDNELLLEIANILLSFVGVLIVSVGSIMFRRAWGAFVNAQARAEIDSATLKRIASSLLDATETTRYHTLAASTLAAPILTSGSGLVGGAREEVRISMQNLLRRRPRSTSPGFRYNVTTR